MMAQVLSYEQKSIAFHNDCEGAILVEAAAGSGKTRILTERVRYLLTEKRDKFFSVLCLTFTNKAAEEMKERLRGVNNIEERTFIGTFHEFCLDKIIRPRRGEIGLNEVPHIFDENDQKKIIEEVLLSNDDLKSVYTFEEVTNPKEKARKQRDLMDKCVNFISSTKRNLKINPEDETETLGAKNIFLYQDYNRRLINQNAMDYDDILLYAYRILTTRPVISSLYRRSYQYILVDEAQDLNYAQYQIIKTICGDEHRNVMMVGDPKQAIYGFNGSSPKYMQEYFVRDFRAERMEVKKNYRSSTKVLKLAEHIQANGGIGNNYFEGICEKHAFDDEEKEAIWIVQKIKEWLSKGTYKEANKEVTETISLKNIAVLARNKFVYGKLIEKLSSDIELNGKYYLRKGVERFEPESILIKVFDAGLWVLANPSDILHFRQIAYELNIIMDNEESNRVEAILRLNQYQTDYLDTQAINLLIELWKKLHKNPKWLGGAIVELQEYLKNKNVLWDEIEVQKASFDVEELKKFWEAFARKEATENQHISNFRYFLALSGTKTNKEELVLTTVHAVKGLEFEIVFLIGMNEDVFPDRRAKSKNELTEEKNNAYVAVTRAKRCIYITYPKLRIMPWGDPKVQQASRFIKDLPDHETPIR